MGIRMTVNAVMIGNCRPTRLSYRPGIFTMSNGTNSATRPITTQTLKTLLPITLPKAISCARRSDAAIQAASSGSDVPTAISVRPMTTLDMPKASAISTAEPTMIWAPPARPIKPKARRNHAGRWTPRAASGSPALASRRWARQRTARMAPTTSAKPPLTAAIMVMAVRFSLCDSAKTHVNHATPAKPRSRHGSRIGSRTR